MDQMSAKVRGAARHATRRANKKAAAEIRGGFLI
jgi:hypothetical protein